jgi:phospholipid/cholesterol/gamma-HCH transport system ATP-binding protein
MPQPAIAYFSNVSLNFGDTPALEHVSFDLRAGETVVIFGAAGAGKTMLIKTAAGLVKPDAGRVFLFGKEITRLQEKELFAIRSRVGILFQEGGLFDSLTVGENVAYPLLNQPNVRRNGNRMDQAAVDARVRETLRFVELEHTLDKFPSALSGGMRRRVGVARALVTEPHLVLYDSPTAGLDPITANTIIALLIKERDIRNAAAIMVTHRYQDGHLMANFRYNPESGKLEPVTHSPEDSNTRFFVMKDGDLAFEGPEAALRACTDPYVRKFVKFNEVSPRLEA